MDKNLWKIFTSLGVPGLALGIFFMLFKVFKWDFPKVPRNYVGPSVIIFMVLTFIIVFYALTLWDPMRSINKIPNENESKSNTDSNAPKPKIEVHAHAAHKFYDLDKYKNINSPSMSLVGEELVMKGKDDINKTSPYWTVVPEVSVEVVNKDKNAWVLDGIVFEYGNPEMNVTFLSGNIPDDHVIIPGMKITAPFAMEDRMTEILKSRLNRIYVKDVFDNRFYVSYSEIEKITDYIKTNFTIDYIEGNWRNLSKISTNISK